MTSIKNLGYTGSLLSPGPLMSDADGETIRAHKRALDVHMHFIPDFYRDALASANMASPDGINALPPWDEQNFLRVMDKLQIETAILSISSPGVHFGASFNTTLLKILAEKSPPSIKIQVVTLEDIPLYCEDLDTAMGVPAVNALKRLISACDGVLISTPEYNHGIPGVLKNTLDWLSRPAFESCLKDKPVSVISSSKAFTGGVRAQYQLREALMSMHAQLVMGPEVILGGVHRNFQDESYLDEAGFVFMLGSLNRLKDAALYRRLAKT
jgi:chromate reductase, NAD(P)H dehydrogenase (quinone)